ncbi:MAG TPA: hypothetical protein VLE47_04590 [Candidatus Saccharimonadales bacterium]|nr:hypothetical protein [Candidatus Saccharimonadales bacterium]
MKKIGLGILAAVALAAIVGVALTTLGGSTPAKAGDVVAHYETANTALRTKIKPGTTVHWVTETYKADNPGIEHRNRQQENWVQFDDRGVATKHILEETDLDTGEVYVRLVEDGGGWTTDALVSTFNQGDSEIGDKINKFPKDAVVPVEKVKGKDAFIFTIKHPDGKEQLAIDKATSQLLKQDSFRNNDCGQPAEFVEATVFTVFEVLGGNAGTDATAFAPTATATPTELPTDFVPEESTPMPTPTACTSQPGQ